MNSDLTPSTYKKPLVVVITGPTGSGKTILSIYLAKLLRNVEIVSCDSMAVYREMNLGTSKPDFEIRKQIPHHLIDIISVKEEFNVAKYVELAKIVISEITERNNLPLIVGGSLLYLYSLLDGIFKGPGKNLKLREEFKKKIINRGIGSLYQELEELDPQAASGIHFNDSKRIIRALEVYYQTGKRISELRKKKIGIFTEYEVVIYGLEKERKKLYTKIDERVNSMIARGLIDEVRELWRKGMSLTASQAHGYKEIIGYLEANYELDEAIRLTKRNTRRYAKRQISWLRRDRRVNWVNLDEFDSYASASEYIFKDLKRKRKI